MSDDKLKELTEATEDEGLYGPEFDDALSGCPCGGKGTMGVWDFDEKGDFVEVDSVVCPFCQPQEEPGDL